MDFILLSNLKRHGFYRGKLREVYDQKLQDRLAAGEKLYLLSNPDLMGNGSEFPGLLVEALEDSSGENHDWLFELTITVKMAQELKASNLQLDDELEVNVWIPWTRSCANAPMVQLCGSCWEEMPKVIRKRLYKDLQYPYICDDCGEVYSYKQLTEETRDQVEGNEDE